MLENVKCQKARKTRIAKWLISTLNIYIGVFDYIYFFVLWNGFSHLQNINWKNNKFDGCC